MSYLYGTPPNSARPIPFAPGYRICPDGTVWSSLTPGRNPPSTRWHIRRPATQQNGYLSINLTIDRKVIRFLVHRLVLEVFAGPCPPGQEACHNKGNRKDNLAEKLRWDTHVNNLADRAEHGTDGVGERNPRAKLVDADILKVFSLFASGVSRKSIAKRFGISSVEVSYILNRKVWSHIEVPPELLPKRKNPKDGSGCVLDLSHSDIVEIFRLKSTGVLNRVIAEKFGISLTSISYILNRKTWAHVPIPPEYLPR